MPPRPYPSSAQAADLFNPVVSEPLDPGVAYDDYRQFDVISGLRDTAQPITETLIYTLYFQDDQAVAHILTATLADGFSTESDAYAALLDALDGLTSDAETTLTGNLLTLRSAIWTVYFQNAIAAFARQNGFLYNG